MIASRVKQIQTFTSVMQMVVLPLFFLSGALYPVSGLPAWLAALNRVDPVTYAVDPMRRLVLDHVDVSDAARATLDPGVSWWGWHLPVWFEVAMLLLLGLAMMGVAVRQFQRME
jgi:ABC-2 type transport system permease protein